MFVSVNTNEQSAKAREHKNIDYEILRKKSRCFWNFNPVSVGFCMRSEALVDRFFLPDLSDNKSNCKLFCGIIKLTSL